MQAHITRAINSDFFTKRQICRPVQMQSICRQEDKCTSDQKELKFVLRRVENIVRKGENAGYQHFLLISRCFHKLLFSRH